MARGRGQQAECRLRFTADVEGFAGIERKSVVWAVEGRANTTEGGMIVVDICII